MNINNNYTRWLTAVAVAVALPFSAQAIITTGVYELHNHPDGSAAPPLYGLRLDGLLGEGTVWTFDFDHADSAMFLEYDSVAGTMHIYGTSFGGSVEDGAYTSPAAYNIDFTYNDISSVGGDDDLMSSMSDPQDSGFIAHFLFPLEGGIPLYEYDGSHDFSFRLGNEDDDLGHRGHDGISGWGWLNHTDPDVHIAASDWLFTLGDEVVVPEPGTYLLLGSTLLMVGVARRRKAAA